MIKKKIFLNISFDLFLQIITIFCGFVLPNLIIKHYGSEVNGLIYSISQFLGYIVIFDSGIGNIVKLLFYQPLVQNDIENMNVVFNKSQIFFKKISYILIVYILILAIILPLFFSKTFDFLFVVTMVLIVGANSFSQYYYGITYQLLIQADQKGYVISLIQSICVLFSAILSIILINMNVSIHLVKFISLLFLLLKPFFLHLYVKKHYTIRKRAYDHDFKFNQKWDSFGHHIAAIIHGNTDIVILTIFSSNLLLVSVYSIYNLIIKSIENIVLTFSSGMENIFGNMLAKKESEDVIDKFNIYETISLMLTTLFFSITIITIIPFINLYTSDFKDANYIEPLFCFVFIIGSLLYCYQIPYIKLVYSIGHFKETKWSAYSEAIINIVISIILVRKMGLVGVAIGTTIAVMYRYIFHIYYVSKKILNRSCLISIKKNLLNLFCLIINVFLINLIKINVSTYFIWIIYAIIIGIIAAITTVLLNLIFYKKDVQYIKKMIIGLFIKKANCKKHD